MKSAQIREGSAKAECRCHPSERFCRRPSTEFSERGLPAASTDDIAERCGVNKRMIYYYFGSKEGLYLAALEFVFENLVALEKEIEVEHLEPAAAIEAMINLKIDYYLDESTLRFVSLDGEFLQGPAPSEIEETQHVQDSLDRCHCAHS